MDQMNFLFSGEPTAALEASGTSAIAVAAATAGHLDAPDLDGYDVFIIAFSGGKDSLAMVLDLLERGVPKSRIELWHHEIDGREGSRLMDWPVTRDYCRKVAAALGLRLYFSWRVGGFERELRKENDRIAAIAFETPDGLQQAGGKRGRIATRRKFPQVSPDLSVRWCSPALKIDVMAAAISNQTRFWGQRVLVLTGERAEESRARARYRAFETHRCSTKAGGRVNRVVHVWRSVHAWTETAVWAVCRRWGVVPHPCYRLGWARASCAACVFGSPNQWASLQLVNPGQFEAIADLEAEFGVTIRRDGDVRACAARGKAYAMDPRIIRLALSDVYDEPVLVDPAAWELPSGAFGENAGPC